MKFHWFAEVTYPYLAKDFAQKYDGSWVDIPRSLYDPHLGHKVYNDFLSIYEYADSLGFDSIAVNEHHQYAGAVTPSPNLFAAILARSTKNAAILIIGDSIALYNPPIRVAEEIAMLDVLSGGRVIAGFVLGTPMDAAFCYGVPPGQLRERWREAHDLILRAWREQEPFTFNGKYTKLRYVNLWPRLIQEPHPPIWVPGSGSLETWELTTQLNYCYAHLSFSGLQKTKPTIDKYWEYVNQVGGDNNPYRFAFPQLICMSDTDSQIEAEYREAVEFFYNNVVYVAHRFANAPGYKSTLTLKHTTQLGDSGSRGGVDKAAAQRSSTTKMTFWDYVDKGYVIAGSPSTVRSQLEKLVTELRIGHLICILHMGNLSQEQARKNTRLFATEVIPYLRHYHSEYEDKWMPQRTKVPVGAYINAE